MMKKVPWMKPHMWMHEEGGHYVSSLMAVIFITGMVWVVYSISLSQSGDLKGFVKDMGVSVKRVSRAAKEIERKTFHLCGLIVPVSYTLALDYFGYTQKQFAHFALGVTALIWAGDVARVYIPFVKEHFPMKKLLREKEQDQLSGTCFFSLGCTLSIVFFPPAIACCSIVFLVLGDMSAALIGVSFGGEVAVVKLGREGKKSVEGSVAMLLVCWLAGFAVFGFVPLSEYVALVGAIVATAVELYEPFSLDDNLTIPLFTSFALTWAMHRVAAAAGLHEGA